MSRLLFNFRIVALLPLLLTACSQKVGQQVGQQGEWLDVKDYKIIVKKVTWKESAGRKILKVMWEVENTFSEPVSYQWETKYLVDQDGNLYRPSEGYGSSMMQPHDKTGDLYDGYSLPDVVNIQSLHWILYIRDRALYPNERQAYKIKISPTAE